MVLDNCCYRSRRSRRPHHHRPRIRLHRRCRTIADTSRRLGAKINIFRSSIKCGVFVLKSVDCIFSLFKISPRSTKRKRRRSSRNRASRRLSTPLKFFPRAFWPQLGLCSHKTTKHSPLANADGVVRERTNFIVEVIYGLNKTSTIFQTLLDFVRKFLARIQRTI